MTLHLSYRDYITMCDKEGWDAHNPLSDGYLYSAKEHSKLMKFCLDMQERFDDPVAFEEGYQKHNNKRIKNMYLALEMAEYFNDLEQRVPGFQRNAYRLKKKFERQVINERTLDGIYDFRHSSSERQTTIH